MPKFITLPNQDVVNINCIDRLSSNRIDYCHGLSCSINEEQYKTIFEEVTKGSNDLNYLYGSIINLIQSIDRLSDNIPSSIRMRP